MEDYSIQIPSLTIIEREYYVSRILSSEQLKQRWEMIKYVPPINGQLKLKL